MFQKLLFSCAGILNFEHVCIAPVYAQALLRRPLTLPPILKGIFV
jgi:hypothetical protein